MAHTNPTPPASSPPQAANGAGSASQSPLADLVSHYVFHEFGQGVAKVAELVVSIEKAFQDAPEVARARLNRRDPDFRRFDALVVGSACAVESACSITDARRNQNARAARGEARNAALDNELAKFEWISDERLSFIIRSFHGAFTEFENRAAALLWQNLAINDSIIEAGDAMSIAHQLGLPEIATAIELERIEQVVPPALISRGPRSL